EGIDQLRNGNVLVHAAIEDAQADLPDDSKWYVTPEIARLRKIDAALLTISFQVPEALDTDTRDLVASHFRDKRDEWEDPIEGINKVTADKNKQVYDRILQEIYEQVPLPESALGEAPVYEFG